jgi:hypothetical protein
MRGERLVSQFLGQYWTEYGKKQLLEVGSRVCRGCVCEPCTPNTVGDRGLVGAMKIPTAKNSIVYMDFITGLPKCKGKDTVMVLTDALTRFTQVYPTTQHLTGEGAVKLFLDGWVKHHGLPTTLYSDNDRVCGGETGFYHGILKSMGVNVYFSPPYHSQSNGQCERENQSWERLMRIYKKQYHTEDWVSLNPWVVWTLNNSIARHGYTPHELFNASPPWPSVFESLPPLSISDSEGLNTLCAPCLTPVGAHLPNPPGSALRKVVGPHGGPVLYCTSAKAVQTVQKPFGELRKETNLSPPIPSSTPIVCTLAPAVDDWLSKWEEKLVKARAVLTKIRAREWKKRNQRRQPATYKMGDLVYVHHNRLPSWVRSKLDALYFGPFLVTAVFPGSVLVKANPNMGGEIEVAFSHLKRCYPDSPYDDFDWSQLCRSLDMDNLASEWDEEVDKEHTLGEPSANDLAIAGGNVTTNRASQLQPEVGELSAQEAKKRGYYHIKAILSHKYTPKGLRFLTWWEDFQMSEATWEPKSCFKLPNGRLNGRFVSYCQKNRLKI